MERTALLAWACGLSVWSCGSETEALSAEEEAVALIAGTERPDIGEEAPAFVVQPGLWTYDDGGVANNTCGAFARSDGDLSFFVSYSEASSFVVVQGEPWGDFACFVAGTRFACPARLGASEAVPGADAVVSYSVQISGELVSATVMSGVQEVSVTCEGSSCALAPAALGVTLPCGWSAPFEATRG